MSNQIFTSQTNQQNLLTISEAKRLLRCSHVFLWQRRKSGEIKAIKVGKKVLFPVSSLNEFLEANKEEVAHG